MTAPESERRLFAVIPAGGFSRRMGRPKLLLPLGGQTVIRRVLDVLKNAGVAEVYILIREEDAALRAEVAQTMAVIVTTPVATRDMRASVEILLQAIQQDHRPDPEDGWLLCPADHPVLDAGVVRQLIQAWRGLDQGIVLPVHDGRRGHPVILDWSYAGQVSEIPTDRGINWLLETCHDAVCEEMVGAPGVLSDLDTPADYELLLGSADSDVAGICDPETG